MKTLLQVSLISLLSLFFINSALAQYPVADFTTSAPLCANSPVQFTDASYDPGANTIISWLWDFGDGNTSTLQNPTNTYASGSNYTVSLIVNNDVGGADTTTQIINVYTVDITILGSMGPTCFGSCDGFITASASLGSPPYNYQWDDPLFQITPSIGGLCAGTYNVIVTDDIGCTQSLPVVLNEPAQITISISGDNICGGCNGTAITLVNGGIPAYTYTWSNGSTGTNLWGACSGVYGLTVTDANGCAATNVVNIPNVPAVIDSIGIVTTPSFCNNGQGTASVTGVYTGTPPYTYLWSNGDSSQAITNLFAGIYYITVVDANGCSKDTSLIVLDSAGFTIVLDSIQHNNCANNQMGYIGINTNGGLGPFTYLWSPGGQTTTTITDLLPGNYYVNITDQGNSCQLSEVYTIYNSYNLYASIASQNANCTNNGSITVSVQGLNPPFTYLWDDPLAQTDSSATGLLGGTYHVTITDVFGCTIIAHDSIVTDCFNVIQGMVYNDDNENCIYDTGELPCSGTIVRVMPGNYFAITDTAGNYILSIPNMINYISISNLPIYNQIVCPVNNVDTVSFTILGDTATNVDFAITADSSIFDLLIHPGWTQGHPGFDKTYWFYYYNNGTYPIDATVNFVYDTLLQYISCTQGGVHDALSHTITWYFPNLAPSSFWNWNQKPEVFFNVPASASIYDSLETYFEILPIIGDVYPQNNTLYVDERITGSHDPNDKQVYPGGLGVEACILPEDSVLFYTIRFQNNGNDTAFTVIVTDTLSPYLNPSTLIPGSASHPYTLTMTEHGILTFRFDQILLPDSNTNEMESKGYFNFSINQKPVLPWGTVITNNAAIYFDFNPPIITNTVINTICEPTLIIENITKEYLKIYPNPANDILNIESSLQIEELNLIDITGKKVITQTNIDKTTSLDVRRLNTGLYFIHLTDVNGSVSVSKFIKK